ncbi:hypothetical protein DL96DRAFT_1598637 [Flagelloscypha sp. PMI_526]|nr:hypothetical protein DL96DRAFT_1598637 [Flagelloscypha sp. PMI_526]
MADPRSQNLQRNPEYYLMGGDAHFLVGNQQFFRIHKYFFDRESSHWHNFFAKNPRAGTDESTAIVLDNIHPRDFAAFCWVFYNPVYWLYEATQDQWIAILGLAHEWAFETVKQLAVRELAQLDIELIERINVYQTYEVDEEIIFPYYIELCERDEPLTFQESQLLGPPRERLRAANIDEDGRTTIVEGRDVESTLKDLLEGVPRPEVDNMRESGSFAQTPRSGTWGRSSPGPYRFTSGHKAAFVNGYSSPSVGKRPGLDLSKHINASNGSINGNGQSSESTVDGDTAAD